MLRLRKIMARLRRFIGGFTPMQIIVLVFLAIILAGSGLLMLPVSAKNCEVTPFLTALFTATSCTCVTGLSLVDTGTYWSSFGHAVMLCLIQIGGLGFMTIVTVFFMAMRRKIGLKERLVMAQSLGMEDLSGIVTVVKKVLVRTMIVEGAGAVLLVIRFCFQMPFGKALWWGVFHSVSAFCNAGFDIMGHVEAGGSLMSYGRDPAVNLILMALIIVSGLGFLVFLKNAEQSCSFLPCFAVSCPPALWWQSRRIRRSERRWRSFCPTPRKALRSSTERASRSRRITSSTPIGLRHTMQRWTPPISIRRWQR